LDQIKYCEAMHIPVAITYLGMRKDDLVDPCFVV